MASSKLHVSGYRPLVTRLIGQGDEPAEKAQPVMPRLSAEEGWGIDQVEPPPPRSAAECEATFRPSSSDDSCCAWSLAARSATVLSRAASRRSVLPGSGTAGSAADGQGRFRTGGTTQQVTWGSS